MTSTARMNSPASSAVIGPLVGGVLGGITVTGVLLLAVIVCLVVVVKKRKGLKVVLDTPGNDLTLTNIVYDGRRGVFGCKVIILLPLLRNGRSEQWEQ